jgi:tetratricopeptide (TPR) repeat protein
MSGSFYFAKNIPHSTLTPSISPPMATIPVNTTPNTPNEWLEAYVARDFNSVVSLSKQYIKKAPNSWVAWLRYAKSELLIENFDEAETAIDRTLKLSKNDNVATNIALYVKGQILRKKSDLIGVQHIKILLKRNNSELAEKL